MLGILHVAAPQPLLSGLLKLLGFLVNESMQIW